MTFTLGGTEIRLTVGAALLSAFCIVAGEWRALLGAVLSLAAHEAAHALAARNLGIPVAHVTVYPFGAVMRLSGPPQKTEEWIVAAAGPLGSLTAAAFLKLFAVRYPSGAWIERLADANLAIACVNLLPAFPLDGGRVFRALLLQTSRPRTARTLLLAFTAAIALGIGTAGVFLLLRGVPAWTLVAIAPFLVVSARNEWRTPDPGTVSGVMDRKSALKCGAAQKAQIVVLSDETDVGEAISALSARRYTIVRVVCGSGFRELNESALIDAAAKYGVGTPLKTVISRLTERE